VLEIVIPLSQQQARSRRIEIQEGKPGKLVHQRSVVFGVRTPGVTSGCG
jgi:hypothetical protein